VSTPTPTSRGAALGIALALLLVLTLLAIVSVRGTRVAASEAAGEIASRAAFEAAERALAAGRARLAAAPASAGEGSLPAGPDGARASFRVEPDAARAPTDVPEGFSVGADFRAHAYLVTASGAAADRQVRLREDVLVVGAADE